MCSSSQPKFMPKKPVTNVSGSSRAEITVNRLITRPCLVVVSDRCSSMAFDTSSRTTARAPRTALDAGRVDAGQAGRHRRSGGVGLERLVRVGDRIGVLAERPAHGADPPVEVVEHEQLVAIGPLEHGVLDGVELVAGGADGVPERPQRQLDHDEHGDGAGVVGVPVHPADHVVDVRRRRPAAPRPRAAAWRRRRSVAQARRAGDRDDRLEDVAVEQDPVQRRARRGRPGAGRAGRAGSGASSVSSSRSSTTNCSSAIDETRSSSVCAVVRRCWVAAVARIAPSLPSVPVVASASTPEIFSELHADSMRTHR